jgi:hypothetical protein
MAHPIFIIAMPRSRTAWWAAYMSQPDCTAFHEAGMNKTFAEYCHKIDRVDTPYVCDASTGNFIWIPRLIERYPTALFCYVDRDPEAITDSVNFLLDKPDSVDVNALLRAREWSLTQIVQAPRYVIVDFKAIDPHLKMLHELMFPNVPFDEERAAFFLRLNIQLTGEAFEKCLEATVPKELEEEIHAVFG